MSPPSTYGARLAPESERPREPHDALEIAHRHLAARGLAERRLSEHLLAAGSRLVPDRLQPDYLMCPAELAALTREAVERHPLRKGQSREQRRRELFRFVIDGLAERYPGYVDREPTWFLNRCGGAEFSTAMLYVAPHEYAFIIGTNVGICGADSGCYATDVWDFMLEGENYNAPADPFEPVEVTRAGEFTFLGRGQRKTWSLSAPGWMIDYARGFVPSMSPHGLLENLSVTANLSAVIHNGRIFASKMLRSQWRRLSQAPRPPRDEA